MLNIQEIRNLFPILKTQIHGKPFGSWIMQATRKTFASD